MALLKGNIMLLLVLVPVFLCIKIFIKCRAGFLVLCFTCLCLGYLITSGEVSDRDTLYAMDEEEVKATGKVSEIKQNDYGWQICVDNASIGENSYSKILVYTDKKFDLKIGNKVSVEGKVSQFTNSRNYGNFDPKKYYAALEIYISIDADKVVLIGSGYDVLRNALSVIREKFASKFDVLCGKTYNGIWKVCSKKAATMSAVVLGYRQNLDAETSRLYSLSGISHLLAVSGLHVSFFGMMIFTITRKILPNSAACTLSFFVVVCFGLMAGTGVSTARAVIMFGMRLFSSVLGRTYDGITSLSFTALIILFSNPFSVFSSGFQMSFMASAAVLVVYPKIKKIIGWHPFRIKEAHIDKKDITRYGKIFNYLRQERDRVIETLIFSATLWIILLPIVAYYYFEIPTYSIFTNLIVIPLSGVIIASGFFGGLISFFSNFLGRILIMPGCAVLCLYDFVCGKILSLPFSNIIVGKPNLIVIFVYYVALVLMIGVLFILRRHFDGKIAENNCKKEVKIAGNNKQGECKKDGAKKMILASPFREKALKRIACIRYTALLSGAVLVLCVMVYGKAIYLELPFFKYGFYATFLDVGQGDGIFMRCDNGTTVTVDGGSSSVKNVGTNRIIPYLEANCVRKIDYAVMTHADSDHTSGMIELIEQSDDFGVAVKNLILPDIGDKDEEYMNMIETANEHGVNVLYIKKGDILRLGNVYIECKHPTSGEIQDERNDTSTVLSVEYEDFSILLTGDISENVEDEVAKSLDKTYTLLKVAHHGSKYSSTQSFLQSVDPRYAVISVGANNNYGHPASETLERLSDVGCKVYETSKLGQITLYEKRGRWRLYCYSKET